MSHFWLTRIGPMVAAAMVAVTATPVFAATVDAVEAVEAEASEPGPLISWQPGEFIWTILLFLILLAVLTIFVWPHILNGLKDREAKIRNDLAEAEKARKEAAASLEQYKAQLAESRREAQQIIEQSRVDAQKVADDIKAQAQQEIEQMRVRVQREIRAAREEAIAEVYTRTAEIATHIAGRILQREISAEDQKALIDSSLSELARANGGLEQSVTGQA